MKCLTLLRQMNRYLEIGEYTESGCAVFAVSLGGVREVASMKALWIVVFALGGAVANGQGTILFSNRAGILDAPVRNASGELVPTNSVHMTPDICRGYTAELLVGSDPVSVAPFSTPAVRGFSQPGYFGVGDAPVSLPGYPPGSHPWFMVRVLGYADFCITTWQIPPELVEYGRSGPYQLNPAGPGLGDGTSESPAPPLDGMQSFRLVDRDRGSRLLGSSGPNSC
jgi:hypothetical protein